MDQSIELGGDEHGVVELGTLEKVAKHVLHGCRTQVHDDALAGGIGGTLNHDTGTGTHLEQHLAQRRVLGNDLQLTTLEGDFRGESRHLLGG